MGIVDVNKINILKEMVEEGNYFLIYKGICRGIYIDGIEFHTIKDEGIKKNEQFEDEVGKYIVDKIQEVLMKN